MYMKDMITALQSQKAVTAYFLSKQLLHFVFARQNSVQYLSIFLHL